MEIPEPRKGPGYAVASLSPFAKRQNPQAEMPFLDHLAEMRMRLLWCLLAIFLGTLAGLTVAEDMFHLLSAPLEQASLGSDAAAEGKTDVVKLIGIGVAEAFVVKLKIAIAIGFFLALPCLFYQLWAFIEPGLSPKEKKFALPFVAGSSLCFLLGALFCFYLVLPFAFEFFLAEYASLGVSPDIRIGEYLSFTLQCMLVFGLVFELPVLSYFLARLGILTHHWLLHHFRYIVVGIFVLAAIITPPDVVTQLLLAIPMLLLYGLSILIAYYFSPKKKTD